MKIFIIRHGQTGGNKRSLLQGRGSNGSLNETGVRQAETARMLLEEKGVRFDRVLSSPLTRALETARIVSGLEPVIDERLTEMDCGPYEGTDLTKIPPELAYFFSDFVNHPAPEGMESLASIEKRAAEVLKELAEEETPGEPEEEAPGKSAEEDNVKNAGGCILLSTHAIAMKGFLEVLTPDSRGSYWSKYIGNCDVYVTERKDGAYTVPELFVSAEEQKQG